jgi:hypothetical protein
VVVEDAEVEAPLPQGLGEHPRVEFLDVAAVLVAISTGESNTAAYASTVRPSAELRMRMSSRGNVRTMR